MVQDAPRDTVTVEQAMPSLGIDPGRLWSALFRHRYAAGGIVALTLAAGIALALLTTPVFSARAALQIDSEASDVLGNDSGFRSLDWDVERFLLTQVDVLLSRGTALTLIERNSLAADDRFFERMRIPAPERPEPGKTMAETRRDAIVATLQSNIAAQMPRYSRILDLTFESPDPAYAAEIANGYAEAFLAASLARRFENSSYARDYLAGKLAEAKRSLEEAERAQVGYADANNLVNLDRGSAGDEGPLSLTQRTLVTAADALGRVRADRMAAEQRYRTAAGAEPMQIPEVQSNGYVGQIQRELSVIEAERSRDSSRYLTDHPVMQEHDRKIASLKADLNRAVGDIRGSLRQQYQAALRNEQELAADVTRLQGSTANEQARRIEFNILARETTTRRKTYDDLLARLQEVSAAAGITSSNISIIDRAQIPRTPVRPRPLVYIVVALLLGLLTAGCYILVREFLDDAARTPDDIANRFGLPFLGTVPQIGRDGDAVAALDNPRSDTSEAFAALRTSLGLLGESGCRSLLVTSSQQAEGKSLTAYGIARSYARAGKRVLVVDADLRRPSQHRLFAAARDRGLANVLACNVTAGEAVITAMPNLDLMASGPLPPSVPEFLSSTAFAEFHAWARSHYDVVVFDGPPVMGLADAVLLAQQIEHLVFVIEAGRPSRGRTAAAIRRLRDNGVAIDGVVLNRFDPQAAGYGHEYGNYYSYASEQG